VHLDPSYLKFATWFGIGKGTVIASVLAALDVHFVQSLIVAGVSGVIGAIGALGAALIASRESRKTRSLVHDVKRKIGAANRVEDDIEPPTR
jgi:nitrate/nitrite transporter NarK